jgi:ATP/maltotriose-dependent transcriptional regulator MalT
VVTGQAGIGKSSLIRQWMASEHLTGFSVLRAACDASETDLPFGVISQLATWVSSDDMAPTFLGSNIPPATAPFQAGAELLRLLNELQAKGPVAVVVDDLQWADRASLQSLGFVLRRLQADAVMTVLICRTGEGAGHGAITEDEARRLASGQEDTTIISLCGLDTAEVGEMARQAVGQGVSTATIKRLQQHTEGHPLYVQTVMRQTSPAHIRGQQMPLPVPTSLAGAVRQQLLTMPAETRALVEAAAVLDSREPLVLVGQVATINNPANALEPALTAGLLRWWPNELSTPVAVTHPLQRHAILSTMSPRRLRQLHAAAAPLVSPTASWAHRVAAVDGPDAALAHELAQAAGDQLTAGQIERAATYLLWAADVCDTRKEREHHLLTAALQLMAVDQFTRVQQILPEIQSCTSSPMRDVVLGGYAATRGNIAEAEDRLTRALQATRTQLGLEQTTAMAGAWLGRLYAMQGKGLQIIEVSQAMPSAETLDPRLAWHAKVTLATGRALSQGPRAGAQEFADLPKAEYVTSAHADLLTYRGAFRCWSGDLSAALEDLTTTLRFGREATRPILAELLYPSLSLTQYSLGAWDDAAISAENGLAIAATEDKPWAVPIGRAIAAHVPAGRGEWDRAEELLAQAESTARLMPAAALPQVAIGKATLAQAQNDPHRMLDALKLLEEATGSGQITTTQLWWRPLHTEALIGAGHLDEATTALERLQQFANTAPCLHIAAALLSGRLTEASTGDAQKALSAYKHGLDLPETANDIPLHRGMLEHAYGQTLAAKGQPQQATVWLQRARERFLALGARPFLDRCESDLATASPATVRSNRNRLFDLTGREREIAHLVGRGLTNKEIAAELFISAKTVEYHLGNIYSRLNLIGRRQLRREIQTQTISA